MILTALSALLITGLQGCASLVPCDACCGTGVCRLGIACPGCCGEGGRWVED